MEDRYLFKAKRIDNMEWAEGHYITNEKDPNHAYIGYLFGVVDGMVHDTDIVEVIPSTICQCTGLKDKNGKLIWENDIVKCLYNYCGKKGVYVGKVIYREDTCCFVATTSGNTDYEWLEEGKEVIGNAFDNPELLESEG